MNHYPHLRPDECRPESPDRWGIRLIYRRKAFFFPGDETAAKILMRMRFTQPELDEFETEIEYGYVRNKTWMMTIPIKVVKRD